VDPLLPDSRVARIENALRLRYPTLPGQVAFATYHQPREVTVTQDGLEVPVEAQAVMLLLMPNPRHPTFIKQFAGRIPMSQWQPWERDNRHSSDLRSDLAYRAFATMVPQLLEWHANTLALSN